MSTLDSAEAGRGQDSAVGHRVSISAGVAVAVKRLLKRLYHLPHRTIKAKIHTMSYHLLTIYYVQGTIQILLIQCCKEGLIYIFR